jgi:hypothetical protein
VGAENLCHQEIFMNHTSGAVAPPDAEVLQVGDTIWQQAERAAWFRVRCGRCVGCWSPQMQAAGVSERLGRPNSSDPAKDNP